MMLSYLGNAVLLSACAMLVTIAPLAAQVTYRVVAYSPYPEPASIIEGAPEVFYSEATGNYIMQVTAPGVVTTIASFPGDLEGISSPIMAANGRFYATRGISGEGTGHGNTSNVFSVSSEPGSVQNYPNQSLSAFFIQNLPDATLLASGVPLTGNSYIYNLAKSDLSGNLTSFYQFPSTDVAGAVFYGANGDYYGTANTHSTGLGYVYQLTPSGTLTKIYNLTSSGASILIQNTNDGNFYGTTTVVGDTQHGTAYRLTPGGQYSLLHTFGTGVAGVVDQLLLGSDGKLYGVTGNNTFFSLTTSGQYRALYQVTNGDTQGLCPCTMMQASDGIFYGTAVAGGPEGTGLIFALDAGLPIPAPRSQQFEPQTGAAGTVVRMWGYNLLSGSVQFNGVPAVIVSNKGPNYIFAAVPEGATTGPISITTPGGTVTTKSSFTVGASRARDGE